MAFDEELAGRVRDVLAEQSDGPQKRMFGGLAWLVHGHIAVVARGGGGLMVARADHAAIVTEPGTATMMMRGRLSTGWTTAAEHACATRPDLATWVRRRRTYALTSPGR